MAMSSALADACRVNVDLLVIPDCPNADRAEALLRTALDDVGLGRIPIRVAVIETQEQAVSRDFLGSPTIRIDGRDPFAQPELPSALACRVYPGASGLPDLRDLRQALKRGAAEGRLHE
jgi:uncharacterized protein YlaN (UPF0358 family)